jgi:hypothetical protein
VLQREGEREGGGWRGSKVVFCCIVACCVRGASENKREVHDDVKCMMMCNRTRNEE